MQRRQKKQEEEEGEDKSKKTHQRMSVGNVCVCGCREGLIQLPQPPDLTRLMVQCACLRCGPDRDDGLRRCIIQMIPLISDHCEECRQGGCDTQ